MEKVLVVLVCLGIVRQALGGLYCEDGQLRLVDGSQWNTGRLEACYHNEWGTVCSQWFDINDARVACGKLGFDATDNEDQYSINTVVGPNISIAVGFLQCTGIEADFLECDQNLGRTFLECSHDDDTWLTCPTTGCSAGAIRLVGGNVATEGTLEVCENQAWNAICADSFGQTDAFVACRELGYPTTNVEVATTYRIDDGRGNPTLVTGFNCYGNEGALYSCPRDNTCETFDENNSFFRIVGIKCNGEVQPACTDLVRLADGPSQDEGRLEYCLNGAWGTVGASDFDIQDGQVACKGFYTPPARVKVYAGGNFGMGNGGVYFDEVACIGSEDSVLSCPSNTATYDHDHYNDVGLKCMPRDVVDCVQDGIQLSNGGRVEVCNSDEWGSICSQDWDRNDAMVACRQLGFGATPYASFYTASEFGDGDVQMFASELQCDGTESNLYGGCTKNIAKLSPSCVAGNTAGLRCFEPQNDDECSDGQIRLNPMGESNREGDVQICRGGVWGYICPGGNDANNAEVICRKLGYPSTWSVYSSYGLFNGSQAIGPIMYDGFNCNGNEGSLADCSFSDYGTSYADCSSILGVQCQETITCTNGDIRLQQGGDGWEGRVEVCTGDSYATIGDNNWDYNDAQVVCGQLGYHVPWSVAVTGTRFSNGKKRVAYSSVNCTGAESSLGDCDRYVHDINDPIQGWYDSTRAGVECQAFFDPVTCTEGTLRLVRNEEYNDLNNEREGRLEFCINGYWVTFCTKGWTAWDTAAACRNLGFETLDPRLKFSGQGTGPVYLSPQCEGYESDLWNQCSPNNAQGTNDCGHFNDVGIECPATAAPYYQVWVVPATEGPYTIGSTLSVQCAIEPTPPAGSVYSWWSLVTVGDLYSDPSSPWAALTLAAGTPSFGYLYCGVNSASGDDLYGIGVAKLEVQGIVAPVAPEVTSNVGDDITLRIYRTDHPIVSKLLDLNWYYEGTKITELMDASPNKYSISSDWLTLTIKDSSWDDAGLYQAQYDRLSLYSFDDGCEKLSIDILRNFPVMSTAVFAVSVGESTVSHPGPDLLLATNPDYQTFTRDTGRVQFDVTRQTSLRDSALEIHTLHNGLFPVKRTTNVPISRVILSDLTFFNGGFYESALDLDLDKILTDGGCDLSFGTQYKQFFNDYLDFDDSVSIEYSLARLQYYEYPTANLTSDREYFMASMNAVLTCSPWGGYPLHHAISINKNGQAVASALTYGDDFVYTTSDSTPWKYGVYWCIVDNTVVQSMSSVLVQEAAKFSILFQVESCTDWDGTDIPSIEASLQKRFEEACDCSLDRSIFWQSSLDCSDDRIDEETVKGVVNVSTIFVYSNDDGDVTASTVIASYDGEIERGVNQFLIINGAQLLTGERVEPTKKGLSTGAIIGIAVGCAAAVVILAVLIIIVIAIVCVRRRRKGTKQSSTSRPTAAYNASAGEEKAVVDVFDDDD